MTSIEDTKSESDADLFFFHEQRVDGVEIILYVTHQFKIPMLANHDVVCQR